MTPIRPGGTGPAQEPPRAGPPRTAGGGSSFLELGPDGTTRIAVQAPPQSKFAFAMRDERDGSVRGRHAFPGPPGFQRRIFPDPQGLLLHDGEQVVALNPDASIRETHAAPWRPPS